MRGADRAIDVLCGAARNQRPWLGAKRVVAFEVIAGAGLDPLPADEHLIPGERSGCRCHKRTSPPSPKASARQALHHIDNVQAAQMHAHLLRCTSRRMFHSAKQNAGALTPLNTLGCNTF